MNQFRIGELLVQKKLITSAELEQCLAIHHACGKKLGEIFVQNHLLSESDLEGLLKEQYWRNAGYWVID